MTAVFFFFVLFLGSNFSELDVSINFGSSIRMDLVFSHTSSRIYTLIKAKCQISYKMIKFVTLYIEKVKGHL